ncbi:leucine Rich repeat-containing domain protein [Dictyocaulus viviparus]|uniref:Leucine Rich repeat-containing domain protein n=1 Tax=Dictyocaulus viviparus TaxID=29172 RepID=A0A0D8XLS2_DICVI|nr:leucine Rich repeat-containing domain protein [Dictyocaulus viviparus]
MEDAWPLIFTYLSPREILKCERVCREWRIRSQFALLQLRDVDFETDFPGAIVDSARLERILRSYGRRLRRVTFRVTPQNEKYAVFASEHHLTRNVVDALISTSTHLQSIVVDRMIITIGAIEAFSRLPHTLEEFAISNCRMSCSTAEVNEIVQTSLCHLLSTCSKLKCFKITGRGWIFDHFVLDQSMLLLLPVSIRDLTISAGRSLKITNLNFLKGKRLKSLALQRSLVSSADLTELLGMASSLTTLDLTSCMNIANASVLGKLYNLRCLYLGNNRELSDDSLLCVCCGCSRLQRLALDNCSLLSSNSLRSLERLFELEWLWLAGIGGDNDFERLFELEWLWLAGIGGVNDFVLQGLSNCRQLQMLDIKFCRNVTEVGLIIVLNFPMLYRLEVRGIRAYSKELLRYAERIPETILSDSTDANLFTAVPIRSAVIS